MSIRITAVTAPTIATITATAPVVVAQIPKEYGLITFTAADPNAAEIKVS